MQQVNERTRMWVKAFERRLSHGEDYGLSDMLIYQRIAQIAEATTDLLEWAGLTDHPTVDEESG